MSDNNTRREFVKKGVTATAAVGALGGVGSVAAASSGKIYIDASSSPSGAPYYLELVFEDNAGMSINTESGEFEWSNWNTSGNDVIFQATVDAGASIVISYENTEAEVDEQRTEDEVTIIIE